MRATLLLAALIVAAGIATYVFAPQHAAGGVTARPGTGRTGPGIEWPPRPPGAPPGPTQPAIPPSRARVRFDALVENFGLVSHGTVVKHTFRFENAGADPLEVLSVRTSCGCTAAAPSKRRFLPGERGEVAVAFDTSKKGVGKGRQHFANAVFFQTNDSNERAGGIGVTRLTLEGDVIARYRLIPEQGVIFRSIARGVSETVTASAEIVPASETLPGEGPVPPLVPGPAGARIVSVPPEVEVLEVRPVVRDGQSGMAIDCRIRPDAAVGILSGTIRVATGNDLQREVSLPVRGYIQPPVQAIPPRLFLARGARDARGVPAARTVRIMSARPTEVLAARVVTADGSEPPIEADVGEGQVVSVRVREAAGGAEGAERAGGSAGDVRIFLADPEHPLLDVPYILRDAAAQRADVEAQRQAGLRVSPSELFLGDLEPGREMQAAFIIARAGGEPLEVADLDVEPPGVLEAHLETITVGQVARVTVKPTSGAPGPILARLSFAPRPGAARLSVRVVGRHLPMVAASPEVFGLEGGRPGAVVLRRKDRGPLRVLAAGDPTGRFEIEIEPAGDGTTRLLARVRAGAGEPVGAAGGGPVRGAITLGEVVVKTDVPGEDEVRIPVLER